MSVYCTESRSSVLAGLMTAACGIVLPCQNVLSISHSTICSDQKKPNVVFILSDDQGYNTLGCFGGKVLTPNIDKFANEGVIFTRSYAVSSISTPSRYSCLTGQYASHCTSKQFLKNCPPGKPSNIGFNVQVTSGTPTVARVLKANGYKTGFVGKWHTGAPVLIKYEPDVDIKDPKVASMLSENQRRMCDYIKSTGFDYAASVYRGNPADHKLNAMNVHNMEWITKGAIDFLEESKDKPFFLHICTTLQHVPDPFQSISADPRLTPIGYLSEAPKVQAPRESIAKRVREAGFDEKTGNATWLDDAVGAVIDKLEELGILDNTVIIYFSDNNNVGGKSACYESGVKTPSFMWWKGKLRGASTCDELIANIDFVPTILDICGVQAPADMLINGKSFIPLLLGKTNQWREDLLLEVGYSRGIVTDQWKYIAVRNPTEIREKYLSRNIEDLNVLLKTAARAHPNSFWDPDQLFDLKSDPDEQNNLAGNPAYAKKLAEMKEKLKNNLTQFHRPFGEFVSDTLPVLN